MIEKGAPLFIIKLLVFWYSGQRMFVRLGSTCSTGFCVTNGVKQGGIILPMFFNLYMDDLSLELNCSGIGRYKGTFIHHLYYADDLCLIIFSSSVMQHLLNICKEYVFTISHISYYIMDQNHLHYISRKARLKSVLHYFIWIR